MTGLTNKEVAEHLLGLKKRSLSPGWQDHGSGLIFSPYPKSISENGHWKFWMNLDTPFDKRFIYFKRTQLADPDFLLHF